jgi:hypothetical protein
MDIMKKLGLLLIFLGLSLIVGPLTMFFLGIGGMILGSVFLFFTWTPAVLMIAGGAWLLGRRRRIFHRKRLVEELPEPVYA